MIDKQVLVVGTFSYVGSGAIHALVNNDTIIAPLTFKTLCGSHLNIGHGNSSAKLFVKPAKMSNLSKVTCKGCLDILILKGLLPPKETKESNMSISATIRLKTGPATLVGSYKRAYKAPTHAVIRNDKNRGGYPYRTLCETYEELRVARGHERTKVYICAASFRDVTCKKCLRIMEKYGPKPSKINIPDKPKQKPKQKAFFLVAFDDGDMEIYNSLAKLQDKMEHYREEIAKVQIIDSYRTISMKTVLVDEDGEEITERSLE